MSIPVSANDTAAVSDAPLLSVVVTGRTGADLLPVLVGHLREAVQGLPAEILAVGNGTSAGFASAAGGDALHTSLASACRAARGEWLCLVGPRSATRVSSIPAMLSQGKAVGADIILPHWRRNSGPFRALGQFGYLLSLATKSLSSVLSSEASWLDQGTGNGTAILRRSLLITNGSHSPDLALLSGLLSGNLRVRMIDPETGLPDGGKATALEIAAGMALLWHLRFAREARRIVLFLLIGLLGLALNSALLAVGKGVLGLYYLLAAVLAAEVTTACNYLLVAYSVFPDRNGRRQQGQRFLKFLAMNNASLAIRGPIMYVLTSLLGVHYLISNVLAIVLFTIVRYLLADKWIWRPAAAITV